MRRFAVCFFAVLLCAVFVTTAQAQMYDRYERPRGGDYPPARRGAGVPPPQHAVYGQPYFFAHLGVFSPNSDTEGLTFYDSGINFDLGIGSRVSPILAVEGTFGGYSTEKKGISATVVPLTLGVRLIIPSPVIEPYLGAGLGIYFSDVDFPTTVNSAGQPVVVVNESDTTLGAYGALGVDAWLNPRVALNLEGKYHWAKPSIGPFDVNVGGWTLNLGVRVSF